MSEEPENEYEAARAARIKQNQAMLAQLKVKEMAEALANDNPAAIAAEIEAQRRAAVHQRLAAKAGPLRRSSRAGAAVTTERLQQAGQSTIAVEGSDAGDASSSESSGDSEVALVLGQKRPPGQAELEAYDPADDSELDDSAGSSTSASGSSHPGTNTDTAHQQHRRTRLQQPQTSAGEELVSKKGKGKDCGGEVKKRKHQYPSFLEALERPRGDDEERNSKRRRKERKRLKREKRAKKRKGNQAGNLHEFLDAGLGDEEEELQLALALSLQESLPHDSSAITPAGAPTTGNHAAPSGAPQQTATPPPTITVSSSDTAHKADGAPLAADASSPATAAAAAAIAQAPTSEPAKGSKPKKPRGRAAKGSKKPEPEEVREMFQQLQPRHGCLSAAGLQQVADQVLPDGLDYAEVGNMLRFAASVSDCAPNQLSQDTFDRLVAHLYG